MSTTAIIRFNVRDAHDPKRVETVRLRQYADGYGDFVYPRLELSLEEARNMAILSEGLRSFALSLAATYEAHANEDMPASSRSITTLSTEATNRSFGGDYKYVVDVHIDEFADSVYWRVVGPNEYF